MLPYEAVFQQTGQQSGGAEKPGTRLQWMRGLSRAKQRAYREYMKHMAQVFAEVDAFDLVEEEAGAEAEEEAGAEAEEPASPSPALSAQAGECADMGDHSSLHDLLLGVMWGRGDQLQLHVCC
jgi:hypothetical protein